MNLKLTRFTFQPLLAVLLLVGALSAKAAQSGDFTYTANSTAVTITGYTGAGGAVTIPSAIGGLPVKNVEAPFAYNSSLTSVTIPNSVTSISDWGFVACGSLTSLVVDAANPSYSSVAGVLFNKNQTTLIQYPAGKIGSFTVPTSVTSIGEAAFYGCNKLTSVTIPNSVTSIGHAAFLGCNGLVSVTMPNSMTRIGDYAFQYCGFSSITIPNSVTSIGEHAFNSCGWLTSVTIPSSVISIGTEAFQCSGLTSVTIPNSVTRIGWGAFESTGLTTVTVPSSVTSIGGSAFSCASLARVYFKGSPPVAEGSIFGSTSPSIYYYAGTSGWGISFDGLPTAEALTFVTQPANVGCNQGRRATFTVSTTGAGVAYQWQKGGVDIPNATAATLTLTNVQAADVGNYTVVARNLEGSFTSTPASLAVYPDADGDGLTDANEATYGSNVNQGDTDGDGISDGDEVHRYLSNPRLKDTDGDGYEDGFEIGVGYSPTSATSTPQAVSLIHPAVEFEFSADLGVAYEIQQSLDLQNWTPIETNIVGQGKVETRFYSTQNQPKRYFRVNRY